MERIDAEVRRELGRFAPIEGDSAAIVRAWPRAVGETVARNAWPARLSREGTLHVNTTSATWGFELGRLAETILAQLRAELGEATPRALKFAPGPLPEAHAGAAASSAQRPPAATPEQRAAAAEIAAGIGDEELRRLVARAAAASLSRQSDAPADPPPDDRRF
jgi:hypothetical protein